MNFLLNVKKQKQPTSTSLAKSLFIIHETDIVKIVFMDIFKMIFMMYYLIGVARP